MNRVSSSTRTREAIEKLLAEGTTKEDPRSTLARLGVQVLLEEAHEAKVRDLLGRDYYERSGSERTGYRNGYRQGRLKTTEGRNEHRLMVEIYCNPAAYLPYRASCGG